MASGDSEKKRKRSSEKHDRPRKKAAVDAQSQQEQIDVNGPREKIPEKSIKFVHMRRDDDEDAPVLATTPGISLPSDITLSAYRKRKPATELLLHSFDHPRIDYTAREQQEGGLDGLLKHYIGVYNPDKGEMELIEAKKMSLRSTHRGEEAAHRREQEEKAKPDSMLSQRQRLGLEFGTKKAQKRIKSLTENAISSAKLPEGASQQEIQDAVKANPAAAAVLDSMAASADTAISKEALQAVVDDAKPRPKHNPHAMNVVDVYPVTDASVMGEELLQLVKVRPWFDAIEDKTGVTTSSRFVSHRLKDIIMGRDENSDAVKKVKVCKYLLFLVQFYKSLKAGRKGAGKMLPQRDKLKELVEAEDVILSIIRKKFAAGGELSKWHVDNLLSHIAVLALYIDDFETDTYDLREDLGLAQRTMDTYFKQVGAKMVAMNDTQRTAAGLTKEMATLHKIARLRLPLEFPKQRVLPTKRR